MTVTAHDTAGTGNHFAQAMALSNVRQALWYTEFGCDDMAYCIDAPQWVPSGSSLAFKVGDDVFSTGSTTTR